MERQPADIGLVKTKTKQAAQEMIALCESYLEQTGGDSKSSWTHLQNTAGERLAGQPRVGHYLGSLARILSIEDNPWGRRRGMDYQVQDMPIDKSGHAFQDTAKAVFYFREQQLLDTFELSRANPDRLPAYRAVTNDLPQKYTVEAEEFGVELRNQLSDRIYADGHWAHPLQEYFLPLADTSQIRWSEVGLGVNFGLMLARSAYGWQIDKINRGPKTKVNRQFRAIIKAENRLSRDEHRNRFKKSNKITETIGEEETA